MTFNMRITHILRLRESVKGGETEYFLKNEVIFNAFDEFSNFKNDKIVILFFEKYFSIFKINKIVILFFEKYCSLNNFYF